MVYKICPCKMFTYDVYFNFIIYAHKHINLSAYISFQSKFLNTNKKQCVFFKNITVLALWFGGEVGSFKFMCM